MSTATLMTVEQFAHMKTADTEDYELVAGELIPLSSGTPQHGQIRDLITFFMVGYFKQHPIGKSIAEIDCQLNETTVRRADLSIFLGERARQIDGKKIPIPFPPDIAIEVLSPSETAIGVNSKVHAYLSAGCKEVWLVDADNCDVFVHTVEGVRLFQARRQLESPLLPGFSVPVAELLAQP